MSETSIVAAPRILVYGPQPEGLRAREHDVDIEFVGSSRELFERLTEGPVHLVIYLHAPPASEGTEAVKGIRRLDTTVPVVLASRVQDTMLSPQAIQSQVTWSVGLAGGESVEGALSDLVANVNGWSEKQIAQRTSVRQTPPEGELRSIIGRWELEGTPRFSCALHGVHVVES